MDVKANVHQITQGAMMVALVGVALFINRQLAGLLEFALYWLLSFPILIYTIRYGIKAALVPSVSMVLLAFMIAMPSTIFYLASALITGIIYGGGVRKKWTNRCLLLATFLLTLLSYLITMIVFASVFGYQPQDDIEIAMYLASAFHIEGINIAQLTLFASLFLTVFTALLQTICIHLFAFMILKRLKIATNPITSLFDLHFTKAIGYISICIWVLFWGRNVIKLSGVYDGLLLTSYILTSIWMITEGCVVIMAYSILQHRRYVVFMVVPLLCFDVTRFLLMGLGVIDCMWNLREKMKRGVNNGTFRKF